MGLREISEEVKNDKLIFYAEGKFIMCEDTETGDRTCVGVISKESGPLFKIIRDAFNKSNEELGIK